MKNYQCLNAFSHGQLQDFLTLKTVMDNNQLTFDDIKEAVELKISGELETERPTERPTGRPLNIQKSTPALPPEAARRELFSRHLLTGGRSKEIGSITNRFKLYKEFQPDYKGSLDDFKKLRKEERSKSLNNTPKGRKSP